MLNGLTKSLNDTGVPVPHIKDMVYAMLSPFVGTTGATALTWWLSSVSLSTDKNVVGQAKANLDAYNKSNFPIVTTATPIPAHGGVSRKRKSMKNKKAKKNGKTRKPNNTGKTRKPNNTGKTRKAKS